MRQSGSRFGLEEEQQRLHDIRLQVPKGAFPYQPELGSVFIPAACRRHMTRADCAARAMEFAQGGAAPNALYPRMLRFLPL